MRIRLDGNRAEIILGLFHLRVHFTVYAVSRAYPDRARPHTTASTLITRAERSVTMTDNLR